MVKLLTEPWGRKMHSDYYNMVFGEKLANILYEAVNALFCEREIINNKNIIKKLMFFLSDVNHTKKDVVQSALNIIIDITSGDI